MNKFCLFLTSLVFLPVVHAQEYGVVAGVHQTTAAYDGTGSVSVDGKFNFKLGLAMGFELAPGVRFRSGALYNQRHFETKLAGQTTQVKFDYVDVPANFQYNINEMVGLFGGLVVGINIADKVSPDANPTADKGTNGLIPLADVGVNLLFEDMIGFDLYYEHGLGKIANNLKDFSTFGANFIYFF